VLRIVRSGKGIRDIHARKPNVAKSEILKGKVVPVLNQAPRHEDVLED
jgi:hypothetical protein